MDNKDRYDLVVIGAGVSGLAMTRFYLEVHPNAHVLVLERDRCVGGTWNSARSYDHFWTQWAFPYAEFSDLPMGEPPAEDMYYGFFKAKYTTQYLERYADHHNFAGLSIRDRIAFGTEVKSVTKTENGWRISAAKPSSGEQLTIETSKLAIASGRTSVPKMPVIASSEVFAAPIVHILDFASSGVLADANVKNISVIGGGKSAGDMVYAAVKAGKTVSWIVRPDGHGPAFFAPAKAPGPYRGTFDLGSTGISAVLAPSIWSSNNVLLRFLHESVRGSNLIKSLWDGADKQIWDFADYEGRKSKGGFDKLKPYTGIFWMNGPGGLLNRKDFFETIVPNVEIHHENITNLSPHQIHLQSGKTVECDALLCGTGWSHSFNYMSDSLAAQFGLPYPSKSTTPDLAKRWTSLDATYDQEIASRFPILANPPAHFHPKPTTEPFRLFNSIAPLDNDADHNLVVIGQVLVTNYFRATECQSIWATAYLDGHVKLPSREDRDRDVARTVAFSRRRFLTTGDDGSNFVTDSLRYCHRLLDQLGLQSYRDWWFKELFVPRTPKNLRGLKDEYLAKFESGKGTEEMQQVN